MDDPSYTAGLEELRKLKERLAELEQLATQGPRAGMGDALAGHYSPTHPPVDRERAELEAIARSFVPDRATEAALAARAKDPAGYDAEMRRVAASNGLELALYTRGRAAAIALGQFTPTPEGDPKP